MVSEKKIFKIFFITSPWELMTPVGWPISPKGHSWQVLCRRPHTIATYDTNLLALGLMVSEKIFEGSLAMQLYITP